MPGEPARWATELEGDTGNWLVTETDIDEPADAARGIFRIWSTSLATIREILMFDGYPFSLTEATAEAYLARSGFETLRKAYSEDHHLVLYICRPCDPDPEAMPSEESVTEFFRELRFVQNAVHGSLKLIGVLVLLLRGHAYNHLWENGSKAMALHTIMIGDRSREQVRRS